MKPVLAVIFALLALVPQRGMSAAGTNDQRVIRMEFVADAVLNREELNAVVELAKACGVNEIASVKTFHHLPSGSRGILVTSAERINGRKVSFNTLEVFREGWAYRSKPAVPARSKSSGEFWVDAQQRPTAHELTTFSTPKGTIRVQVSSGIPLDMAERIVNAFTAAGSVTQMSSRRVRAKASIFLNLNGSAERIRAASMKYHFPMGRTVTSSRWLVMECESSRSFLFIYERGLTGPGLERFPMPLLAELRKLFLGGAVLQRCRPVTGAPEAESVAVRGGSRQGEGI